MCFIFTCEVEKRIQRMQFHGSSRVQQEASPELQNETPGNRLVTALQLLVLISYIVFIRDCRA